MYWTRMSIPATCTSENDDANDERGRRSDARSAAPSPRRSHPDGTKADRRREEAKVTVEGGGGQSTRCPDAVMSALPRSASRGDSPDTGWLATTAASGSPRCDRGIVLVTLLVPQGMAYAELAGSLRSPASTPRSSC